jgi:hypothetical protein
MAERCSAVVEGRRRRPDVVEVGTRSRSHFFSCASCIHSGSPDWNRFVVLSKRAFGGQWDRQERHTSATVDSGSKPSWPTQQLPTVMECGRVGARAARALGRRRGRRSHLGNHLIQGFSLHLRPVPSPGKIVAAGRRWILTTCDLLMMRRIYRQSSFSTFPVLSRVFPVQRQ